MAFLGYMTQVTSLPDRTARSICSGLNCRDPVPLYRQRSLATPDRIEDACSSAGANRRRGAHLDVGIHKQDVCVGGFG